MINWNNKNVARAAANQRDEERVKEGFYFL